MKTDKFIVTIKHDREYLIDSEEICGCLEDMMEDGTFDEIIVERFKK